MIFGNGLCTLCIGRFGHKTLCSEIFKYILHCAYVGLTPLVVDVKVFSKLDISLCWIQGTKKVSYTACHSGKLQLACTSPRVIFITKPPQKFDGQDWLLFFRNDSFACWASWEQNSLPRWENPLVPRYRTWLASCTLVWSETLVYVPTLVCTQHI